MNNRVKLLGSNLDPLTMGETIEKVEELIKSGIYNQHVVINASKVNLMQENEELADIINSCPLINADGQSVVWAGRFLGYEIPERVAGIDLFLKLVELCNEKGYRPYFFGAKQEVVEKVVDIFKSKYKNLQVAGYRNGYFKEEESYSIAEEIRRVNTDILFVAFSSPKKEFWISKYQEVMKVPFAMGVGGSFDVVAGITKRAPKWMQKSGLEWFYRFIQEPRRMAKRYIVGNYKFIKLVAKYKKIDVKKDREV
ncbi:WecB/TagA/CpsF family glycosyltransferase [Clostridium swellfunianum]|uniref:WecB/TagA/CpsF family glycosyltransferase n=1 Tax=Clostridium swellfunianum TaxID=1367462 RepID=UPI00202F1DD1|nr:WecB/TagA/CpsF family glycosyltransferase [Clostridium swellfunianum]MCM0647416.1 WecB/TagA/CpsF family glycosyltransferase [Clostridium swellfunianum]